MGVFHADAVSILRDIEGPFSLLVCNGFDPANPTANQSSLTKPDLDSSTNHPPSSHLPPNQNLGKKPFPVSSANHSLSIEHDPVSGELNQKRKEVTKSRSKTVNSAENLASDVAIKVG